MGAKGRPRLAARALAISLLLSLGACGEGNEKADKGSVIHSGEQPEAVCEAICERRNECDGTDVGSCKSGCDASSFENIRTDAVEIIVDCYMDLTCGEFQGPVAFDICWDRAEAKVRPNQTTRSFCFAWSTRWFECGSTYPTEQCEAEYKMFSASFFDRLTECEVLDCAAFDACTDAAAGGT